MSILKTYQDTHNSGRTILFETVYGSKLYGCDMPGSDHDIRGVYAPGMYDFLSNGREEGVTLVPDTDLGESDDILYYPVATFIDQIMGMKNNCVEIYFAARQRARAGETMHPIMQFLLDRKDILVSANCDGFIGHARQRVARYIDGDDPRDTTMQANKFAFDTLQMVMDSHPEAGAWLIGETDGLLETLCAHDKIGVGENKNGKTVLFIHTRQADLTTRVAELKKTIETRLARYMKTADGVGDREKFKDLSTSLRMLETARDLVKTGEITFPIPTAEAHREIRRGEWEVAKIIDLIDATQAEAEHIQTSGLSPLREKLNQADVADERRDLVAQVRLMVLKDLIARGQIDVGKLA